MLTRLRLAAARWILPRGCMAIKYRDGVAISTKPGDKPTMMYDTGWSTDSESAPTQRHDLWRGAPYLPNSEDEPGTSAPSQPSS